MLFNSLSFAIFLPIVFTIYWYVVNKNFKLQNVLLVAASYYFYCCWDWRFGFLLAFSTLLDFYSGFAIGSANSKKKKKLWLILSVAINLGFLGFFKYFNFFIDSFSSLLNSFGVQANTFTLSIILPVGISFYTFHGLSYVFDIYNDKIKPTTNLVNYSLFVSFFPLLVAGPIERATHLLPQIEKPRRFTYRAGADGVKQILWGLFKKLVIADNCARFADVIFNNWEGSSGSTLLLGAVFFAFQIYGDFSGYTDIALGTARLFGFELLKNFNYPYFSRDIAEFWRRWHISLSSWFKDYLYIPLGGSRGSTMLKIRNTFIIFIVSGFWHGANWTFIVWGILHAVYFLPLLLTNNNRNNIDIVAKGRALPTLKESYGMFTTFLLVVIAWIFFRADSVGQAFSIVSEIASPSLFTMPAVQSLHALITLLIIVVFMIIEWMGREQDYAIAQLGITWKRPVRYAMYYSLVFSIMYFGNFSENQFIYFQF